MATGLQWFYGSYVHPKGECYPRRMEIRPMRSERGYRWGSLYRIETAGDFVKSDGTGLSKSEIAARITELDQTYLYDYQDCGFRLSDGTLTPHHMLTNQANNLTGNQIVSRSWDNLLPTEYANTRSFSVAVEALFLEPYSEIVSFREVTKKIGTGGPYWKLYPDFNGDPVKEEITTKTKVRHITSGVIEALSGFVLPPAPYWPNEEQEWRREVDFVGPKLHGHPTRKFTHYRTTYTYYFERIGPDPMTNFNTWYVPA